MESIVGKKIKHILYGDGAIISRSGNLITAKFPQKTMQLKYPDTLGKFFYFAEDQDRIDGKQDDKKNKLNPSASDQNDYLIICRIAYMKYYNGISIDDMPENGGSFVKEKRDAIEKYNFHIYDDKYCYGFFETKYRMNKKTGKREAQSIHIEKINSKYKNMESIDGVRVVFVALSPITLTTVVVGWYDNATVFRDRIIDQGRIYQILCRQEDAHLINEFNRKFVIPKASSTQFGIGQSNIWYIQQCEEAKTLEKELREYLSTI